MYYLVFDHEAKVIANNFLDNGISYLGYYRSDIDSIDGFFEQDISKFKEILENADKVIGYNIKRYDLPILERYFDFNLPDQKIIDIFDIIAVQHNVYLKLDNIAETTLGRGKIANGLDAIRFYKEGKLKELKEYCDKDVEITKDLYEFIMKYGYILYTDGLNQIKKLEIKIDPQSTNTKQSENNISLF